MVGAGSDQQRHGCSHAGRAGSTALVLQATGTNDTPYPEALFSTAYYRPETPANYLPRNAARICVISAYDARVDCTYPTD